MWKAPEPFNWFQSELIVIHSLSILGPVMLIGSSIASPAQQSGLEVNGLRIVGEPVRIRHESKIVKEPTETAPALQEDLLTFGNGRADMRVTYKRYRNGTPEFLGNHPSLTDSSMGVDIGVSPEPWHWHYADTTRIFINDRDIFAGLEAAEMDWREGLDFGRVRFRWEGPEAGVTLHVAIPGDRLKAYVEYVVEPRVPMESMMVRLRCFPGAYTSGQYRQPAHRWVSTPGQSVEVRRGKPGKTLAFMQQDGWIFYADRHHDYRYGRGFGPAGLALGAGDDEMRGEVRVTDYGLDTNLHCGPDQSIIRFVLYAFTFIPNHHALQTLKNEYQTDQETLATLPFWP